MISISRMTVSRVAAAAVMAALAAGCSPTVKVEAPDKPIVINLNIQQEVRIKLDKDVQDLLTEREDLF